MLTLTDIELSALLASFSWAFYFRLTDSGMILSTTYNWVMECRYVPGFIKKILGCVTCFSGQVALWVWLVARFDTYNVFAHILFITLTITLTNLITKWLD